MTSICGAHISFNSHCHSSYVVGVMMDKGTEPHRAQLNSPGSQD